MTSHAPVRVRFFAAAEASAGTSSLEVEWDSFVDGAEVSTLGALQRYLLQIFPVSASEHTPQLETVFKQCSFLIDGRATRDPVTVLIPGAAVDVLPPFAGG